MYINKKKYEVTKTLRSLASTFTDSDSGKFIQRYFNAKIRLLSITLQPVEGAGQSRAAHLPCAARALKENAGHTPAGRPALE